jgi:hypothetical protein
LQLFDYGLTPLPLVGKRPIIKNWPYRFNDKRIQKQEIIDGIVDSEGKIITYKNKNLGIVTGKVSNLIVLDIDNLSSLPKLKELGNVPKTWTVRTNRGLHLYFNYDDRVPSMKLWNSIDVLSDKKQEVAPPSVHPTGTTYQYGLSPSQIQKADLPVWLIEYLLKYKPDNNDSFKTDTKIQESFKKSRMLNRNDIQNLFESADWVGFYERITNNIKGNGEWLSSKCPFHNDQSIKGDDLYV